MFGFKVDENQSAASFASLGFITIYFADSASRKMQEIADILFGHPLHSPAIKGSKPDDAVLGSGRDTSAGNHGAKPASAASGKKPAKAGQPTIDRSTLALKRRQHMLAVDTPRLNSLYDPEHRQSAG